MVLIRFNSTTSGSASSTTAIHVHVLTFAISSNHSKVFKPLTNASHCFLIDVITPLAIATIYSNASQCSQIMMVAQIIQELRAKTLTN